MVATVQAGVVVLERGKGSEGGGEGSNRENGGAAVLPLGLTPHATDPRGLQTDPLAVDV